LGGCAPKTQNIDIHNDKEAEAVMGLDYRDFQAAAQEMIQSMIASGAVSKPGGGKYVLAVSSVVNDTMQHVDTDQLVKNTENNSDQYLC
jgi:PBP1b-binding outer membrane lipoprotein LpoB